MAFNQFPQKGGIPSGNTAGRPSNPVIGDTYYNGQVEALEIYNGTTWKVAKTEGFPPDAPTISSVTDSSTSLAYSSTAGTLDVVFVPSGTGGTATQYNAYTTTGGHSSFTTVGNTVTITGLTPGTAYTVYGNAQNGSGTSTNTANFGPTTPTTLPEVRGIGTATASTSANEVTVTWSNGNNGGKNLSAITITPFLNGTTAQTSRTAATTSSTSYTFTQGQLTNNASYTFKVKATNANGTCADSTATNSATMPNTVFTEYLIIAGGGGTGARRHGGGGGAGGYRSSVTGETSGRGASAESKAALSIGTTYTVTVGNGGTSNTGSDNTNTGVTNGGDSSISGSGFTTITALGGGYGSTYNTAGSNGGCGGASGSGNPSGNAGTGTTGQGYDGGRGETPVGSGSGGGGGGAGAAGGAGSNNQGGNGGNGVASSITGSSVTRAGGGGGGGDATGTGGTGGTGGGGNGANSSNSPTAGTANTGGGAGGGGADNRTVANGGSGVVILRATQAAASTTGSPTYTTSGSYHIYQFNGTGSITY